MCREKTAKKQFLPLHLGLTKLWTNVYVCTNLINY